MVWPISPHSPPFQPHFPAAPSTPPNWSVSLPESQSLPLLAASLACCLPSRLSFNCPRGEGLSIRFSYINPLSAFLSFSSPFPIHLYSSSFIPSHPQSSPVTSTSLQHHLHPHPRRCVDKRSYGIARDTYARCSARCPILSYPILSYHIQPYPIPSRPNPPILSSPISLRAKVSKPRPRRTFRVDNISFWLVIW
jgi:hypothetical protein